MIYFMFCFMAFLVYTGWVLPIIVTILFGISIFNYCYAKHKNKKTPGTYSEQELSRRRISLIVFSVIFGVLALFIISAIILLGMAVAYM